MGAYKDVRSPFEQRFAFVLTVLNGTYLIVSSDIRDKRSIKTLTACHDPG